MSPRTDASSRSFSRQKFTMVNISSTFLEVSPIQPLSCTCLVTVNAMINMYKDTGVFFLIFSFWICLVLAERNF